MVNIYTGLPTNETNGNVQVFHDGKWRFWEQKGYDARTTKVTCRELGFLRPVDYRLQYNLTKVAGNLVGNRKMQCNGEEGSLIDCQHGSWELLNKTHDFYLVWVKCGEFLNLIVRSLFIHIYQLNFAIHMSK